MVSVILPDDQRLLEFARMMRDYLTFSRHLPNEMTTPVAWEQREPTCTLQLILSLKIFTPV